MHKTLVFVIFPLHSSVFHHRTERFVKFDAVLHHDINRWMHDLILEIVTHKWTVVGRTNSFVRYLPSIPG